MVPDRLMKFIGEDNGYLRQFVCPLPFEHFEIGPAGDVLVCCGHWVPTRIGNFLEGPDRRDPQLGEGLQDPAIDDRRVLQVLQSHRLPST